MARDDAPPIARGEYEATAGAFDNLLGREWLFEDLDYAPTYSGARKSRTNRLVRCRLVKNGTGANLLPKRLAAFSTTAGEYGAVVNGYVAATAGRGYPVDEYLPAAGVPDGAYFYIVVEGPAVVLTPLAGSEFNGSIALGQVVVGLTAVTAGATTAGRVAVQNITGSSQATDYTFLFDQIQNSVGRALTARTTGNTNTDLLVEVGKW